MKAKPNGSAASDPAPRNGIPVPPEKRCQHCTAKGTPCRAARRKGGDYCIYHDVEFRKHQAEVRAVRTMLERRKRLDNAEGVHELLRKTAEGVRKQELSTREANTIGYLAQLMMANLQRLQHERSQLLPGSVEEGLNDLVVDQMLDDIESEIKAAGDNAYPVPAARRAAERARRTTREPDAAQREMMEREAADAALDPPSILQMLQATQPLERKK